MNTMQGDQVGALLPVSVQPEKQRLAIKAGFWGVSACYPSFRGTEDLKASSVALSHSQSQLTVKQGRHQAASCSSADTPTLVCSGMGCWICEPFKPEDSGRTRSSTEGQLNASQGFP